MKNINKNVVFAFIAISLAFSSCYKKFDPDTYKPALSIGGFTNSKEISPANLVGYWSFDGTLTDSVSNTNGTNAGTSFTNGIKGQALQGADEAYALFTPGAAITGLQSFTVSTWVNSPLNESGIVGLIDIANSASFWGNLTIFFENGGTEDKGLLKVHVNNKGADVFLGNYELTNPWNTWMNIAVTYDAATSTFKVYLNGAKIATETIENVGPLQFENTSQMVFGTVQFQTEPSLTSATGKQDWASYLTGTLDEMRIYNTALKENEVNALVKLEGRGK